MKEENKMKEPKGIKLNEKWIIGNDSLQFIVYKKLDGKNKDNEPIQYWVVDGYHPSIKAALKSILKQEVLDTGLEDVNKVIARIDSLENYIIKLQLKY